MTTNDDHPPDIIFSNFGTGNGMIKCPMFDVRKTSRKPSDDIIFAQFMKIKHLSGSLSPSSSAEELGYEISE